MNCEGNKAYCNIQLFLEKPQIWASSCDFEEYDNNSTITRFILLFIFLKVYIRIASVV